MSDPTYPDYLSLRRGPTAPPPDPHEEGVRVYADDAGALHSLQSDGTDAAVGGGGSQPLSVLGPYPFAFDDPGLADGAALALFDPPVGSQIVKAWAIERIPWQAGSTVGLSLVLGPKADLQLWDFELVVYEGTPSGQNTAAYAAPEGQLYAGANTNDLANAISNAIDVIAAATVGAVLYGAFTQGASDAYALIWTP